MSRPTFDDRKYFATTAKGAEVALRDELRAKHFRKVRADRGGVHFEGALPHAHRACLELRTASRVLEELSSFECPDEQALYDGVRDIDFSPFIDASQTLAVRAALSSSALTHSGYVAQRVKDAIVDRMRDESGSRPDVSREDPDLAVFVRLAKDRATVYADLSGRALHLRGYRKAQTDAPLKETLAAALLQLAGYQGEGDFVDPMCGSGTIAIEAALLAQHVAPGLGIERFGFERYRRHDDASRRAMTEMRDKLRARARTRAAEKSPDILARDIDDQALEATRANATRAGVTLRVVRASVGSVPDEVSKGATIVTNPPYGERLSLDPADLRVMGRALGAMRSSTVGVIAGAPEILAAIPREPSARFPLMNGDLECRFAVYTPVGAR